MTIQKNDSANSFSIVDAATNADLTLNPKGTGVVVIPTLNATAISNASILARNTGQSADVSIASTTTYTTGGITLANQTAAIGSTWRITAYGQYVAANSASTRNARVACYWGSTALPVIQASVLINSAQTSSWQVEFTITGTSTTDVWVAGTFLSRVSSATAFFVNNATSASTTVTSGTQTLDLRFSMNTVVAGDSWTIQSVTLERLE